MSKILHRSVVVLALTLTACGQTPSDRAISGAGLGAAAGTVGAVIVDGNPLTGALIGATAGAVTGAATNERDINFGKPFWRR